jgi:DNA-binding Lrp family transcriptional regulator
VAERPSRRYAYEAAWAALVKQRGLLIKDTALERLGAKGLQPGALLITAIVLIKAEPQRIAECATKLAGIDGISQVYSVSGEWDLVAMVEVAEHEEIARIVTEGITVVPGIKSTQTLTAFRAYSKKDLEQAWDIGLE